MFLQHGAEDIHHEVLLVVYDVGDVEHRAQTATFIFRARVEVRAGYRSGLRWQNGGNSRCVTVDGHKLHHKGFSTGVNVHDGANVPRLQFHATISGNIGGKHNLFMFLKHLHPRADML